MVAGDYDIKANNFSVNGVLEEALRVVLFLRRPIPKPKRGRQLDAPYKQSLTMVSGSLKLVELTKQLKIKSSQNCT